MSIEQKLLHVDAYSKCYTMQDWERPKIYKQHFLSKKTETEAQKYGEKSNEKIRTLSPLSLMWSNQKSCKYSGQ